MKESLPSHLPVITTLVNQSFKQAIFPDELKRAVVTPLLKNNNLDRNSLKNYRPVPELNFIGKVIEKVTAKSLTDYFDNNDSQDEFQSASSLS